MDLIYIKKQLNLINKSDSQRVISDCYYRIASSLGKELWNEETYLSILEMGYLSVFQLIKLEQWLRQNKHLIYEEEITKYLRTLIASCHKINHQKIICLTQEVFNLSINGREWLTQKILEEIQK